MRADGNILVSPGTGKTEAKRRFDKHILKVFEEYSDCDIHCLASLNKYMSADAKVSSISPSLFL